MNFLLIKIIYFLEIRSPLTAGAGTTDRGRVEFLSDWLTWALTGRWLIVMLHTEWYCMCTSWLVLVRKYNRCLCKRVPTVVVLKWCMKGPWRQSIEMSLAATGVSQRQIPHCFHAEYQLPREFAQCQTQIHLCVVYHEDSCEKLPLFMCRR